MNPNANPLRIQTGYHPMSFMLSGFRPKATINGYEVPLNWGENVVPAPPGQHRIEIHVPYLWKFGKADITVDNTAQSPMIHYAAPVWTFQRGAIGTQPQRPPGVTSMWIFAGVAIGAIVLCCLGSVLLGDGS